MGNCLITRRGGTSGGGGSNDYYWQVQFYDKSGSELLYTEYVKDGENCTYGTSDYWNVSPGQSTPTPSILLGISNNLIVYKADFTPVQLPPSAFTNIQFSSEYGAGNYGTMAFDGITTYPNSWFPSLREENSWISADFTTQQTLIKVIPYSASYNTPNVTLQVFGKKQDGTWENCQEEPSVNYHVNNEIRLNSNAYMGIKIQFTGVLVPSATGGSYTHITEVEVFVV